MRRLAATAPALLSAVLLSAALLLTGCGGGSGGSGGPAMPTVSGSYGDKPTLTFPKGKPSDKVEKKVLHEGTGPVVGKGDLLVADYLGQIWQGKVFDNSYDRHEPAAFAIGTGKVIKGWDSTLVGVKAGSRVLLTIPPAEGYGAQGNQQAGIKGTDTLTFVVDVVTSYPKDAAGDPKAAPQKAPTTGPQVSGALGRQPKVTVPKGTAKPKKEVTTLVAKGSGDPVHAGLVVLQYEAVDYTGKEVASSWVDGAPVGADVGNSQQPSVFDSLVKLPLGSRVLLQIPESNGQGPLAVAVDIIGQPGTAKATAQ